jgi:hypothetical protein
MHNRLDLVKSIDAKLDTDFHRRTPVKVESLVEYLLDFLLAVLLWGGGGGGAARVRANPPVITCMPIKRICERFKSQVIGS